MLNKTQLVFDPEKNGDVVASYLKAADGSLVTNTSIGSKKALDVNVTNANINVFSKPFNSIMVLSKTIDGDPLEIKSQFNNIDVQLVTIIYDEDGDFQSLRVSDY